jgi:uncharacterized protein (DUF58 family)
VSIRPGRNLLRVAGVLAGLAFASFVWSATAWALLAALLLVLVAVVTEYRGLAVRCPQIKVVRLLPNVVGRDLTFQVVYRIEHDGMRPLSLELRDQLPASAVPPFQIIAFHLPAGEASQTLSTDIRIPVRGAFEFGPLWLRIPGTRGLLEAQWSVNRVAQVKVLPESFSRPGSRVSGPNLISWPSSATGTTRGGSTGELPPGLVARLFGGFESNGTAMSC